MNAPTKRHCFDLMCEMEMLEHIARHSIVVSRVALLISDELAKAGESIDRCLIAAAALLHDITKTRSFSTGENHARTGEICLAERGFPEVGDIIGQHVVLTRYAPSGSATPAEIVNYADKRVLHDRIVPLKTRMEYIRERYGRTPGVVEKIGWVWDRSIELEKKLFRTLRFEPDDLENNVHKRAVAADMESYRQACILHGDNGAR